MGVDLLILDDYYLTRRSLEEIAGFENISFISFASGVKALDYLRELSCEELPRAYLVDMRIEGDEHELDSSLKVFKFLHERARTKEQELTIFSS